MKRKALQYLNEWSTRTSRKPLIIRGARQVGKSFLVRLFAKESSFQLMELNFEENPSFRDLFVSNNPGDIIGLIEIKFNITINPENTVLFLDEIQAAPHIIPCLRYFYEKLPRLRVIAAGSLLEFVLNEHTFSMPVGRIEYLFLGPMTFEEFLLAGQRDKLYEYLQTYTLSHTISPVLHKEFLEMVKKFFILGGMPEVIKTYIESGSYRECDIIKQGIISTYRDDFNKYQKKINATIVQQVFDKFPYFIGKKIIYAHIEKQEKSKILENALSQLELARIIYRAYHTNANGIPLGAEKNYKSAKGIFLDVGLLCRMTGFSLLDLLEQDDVTFVNSGSISEQFIGQHLLFLNDFYLTPELYCWIREKRQSSAEIDYIFSCKTKVIPVEVKAGKTGSLKSLQVFLQEKKYDFAVRFNMDMPSLLETSTTIPGPKQSFRLLSLPLYMVEQVKRLVFSVL